MNGYSIEVEAMMLQWKDGDCEGENSETPMTKIKMGAI